MDPNNPKALIQPTIWEPLNTAITALLEAVKTSARKDFSVSFEIDDFRPYPYIQAWLNTDGDYVIEFTSNVYLEPDLNRAQIARLDGLGWRKPNGRNPNYTKVAKGNQEPENLARYITSTLRMVYELDESVWIIFGNVEADFPVYSTDSFWHRLDTPGVVCLPGMNSKETVEGIS